MNSKNKNQKINRDLNDRLRTTLSGSYGEIKFSREILELTWNKRYELIKILTTKDTSVNPENSRGEFVFMSRVVYWKIGYHDRYFPNRKSVDPSSEEVTLRILYVNFKAL